MKILFFTHSFPNYVPDLLLHGMRKICDVDVVDHPRKDCLHDGVLGLGICPDNQLATDWFPTDTNVDRDDIKGKLKSGFFDLVVADLRALAEHHQFIDFKKQATLIIDGEDQPAPFRLPGTLHFCRETTSLEQALPLPMALPEEIFTWIEKYDHLAPQFDIGFFGTVCNDGSQRDRWIENIESQFQNIRLVSSSKAEYVSSQPEGRLGRDDYYQQLQQCKIVLTLRGAGFDTFRYWENSATHGLHLTEALPILIPDPFSETTGTFSFNDTDTLKRQIDTALNHFENNKTLVERKKEHLKKHHLTQHRAQYVINEASRFFNFN